VVRERKRKIASKSLSSLQEGEKLRVKSVASIIESIGKTRRGKVGDQEAPFQLKDSLVRRE